MITSELYYWHDTQNWCGFMVPSLTAQPAEHFENPETKRRLQNLVVATGLWDHLSHVRPEPASDEVIRTVHPQSHIDHLSAVCERGGGDAGELTPAGPASLEIARLAVGGAIAAMGFCLFANAALGIRHVQKTYGLTRIAVVDWDVHHGNGTEAILLDDPGVLTISLHQDNLFPLDSGGIGLKGAGNSNINVLLPPGSGSGAYREAFEQIVIPALDAFAPELIVLPCGYDVSAVDPLGVCMRSSEDFRWMTRQMITLAAKHCRGAS